MFSLKSSGWVKCPLVSVDTVIFLKLKGGVSLRSYRSCQLIY